MLLTVPYFQNKQWNCFHQVKTILGFAPGEIPCDALNVYLFSGVQEVGRHLENACLGVDESNWFFKSQLNALQFWSYFYNDQDAPNLLQVVVALDFAQNVQVQRAYRTHPYCPVSVVNQVVVADWVNENHQPGTPHREPRNELTE